MKKAIIYGAGQVGIQTLWHTSYDYEILGFVDSDPRKWSINNQGRGIVFNEKTYLISPPPLLCEINIDTVFVAAFSCFIPEIFATLIKMGIDKYKINTKYASIPEYSRLNFIQTTSYIQQQNNIHGAIAELGAWKGDTATFISKAYQQERFYLLDTFEGFDERDCRVEKEASLSKANCNDFNNTSIELVKSKIYNPQRSIFIQGFFPKTSFQIPTYEMFKFVNLDVDLYNPIKEGLEFFYPKLVKGGIILVHDYFHPYYLGTKKAVDEFSNKHNIKYHSIGDGFSIFFSKE